MNDEQDTAKAAMRREKAEKKQKREEEKEHKAMIKSLRLAYKTAVKDKEIGDWDITINGMTLEQVKAILDASDRQVDTGQAGGGTLLDSRAQRSGSMNASRGGSRRLGDLDMEDGGFSPPDMEERGCFPLAVQPQPEAENNSVSDEEKSDSFDSCQDNESLADDGINISKFSVYDNEDGKYAWLVQRINNSRRDNSMFLIHSESDETTSAIICLPGWHESKKDLDYSVMFQTGFIVPPCDQQGTPIYFCDCCPECIRARMQAEMLLGYPTVTDEFNPLHQVPSCSCQHISALRDIVKHSGMTAIEFAISVRQTCKWLSNQIHLLAGRALSNQRLVVGCIDIECWSRDPD